MVDEGVIKFRCHWIPGDPPSFSSIQALNDCRSRLFKLGLVGVTPDGIGYGNLSVRVKGSNQFLITGTQTGGSPVLKESHYTRVLSFQFSKNSLTCEGPCEASSESLTHAVLYETEPEINSVMHVHEKTFWQKLQAAKFPTTSQKVAYGTPAMAQEVKRLLKETQLKSTKIFAMGGHEGGVIAFGRDCEEALAILLENYGKYVRVL